MNYMASSGLSVNSVVITIIAIAIGIVLVGSLLAPVADGVMTDLTALGGDGETWANLVGVVVIVSVIGLILVAVNNYTKN